MPRIAFIIPGQGGYLPGAFAGLAHSNPGISDALTTVDAVASDFGREPVSPILSNTDAPELRELAGNDPATLHLAIYASSIAVFRLLIDSGLQPDLLVGHSFGEIAALAAASVITIEDGAVLAAQRDESLRRHSTAPGGMIALNTGYRRADHLLGALDTRTLTIATDNSPDQVVVSGADDELSSLTTAAAAIGLTATRLPVSYPFHNRRLLRDAADDFALRVAAIPKRHPRIPIYSPLLSRYVDDPRHADALITGHLTQPTRFLDAVRTIHADGVRKFVECGVRAICCDLVRTVVPFVETLAPLRRVVDAETILERVKEFNEGTAPRTDFEVPPAATALRSTAVAPQPEPIPATAAAAVDDDDQVYDEAREIYSMNLGYPPEALQPDADLEADLGVDSIKQTELFAKLLNHYGLTMPDDPPRLTSYPTMRSIARLIRDIASRQRV